ncbi:MAG: hypothetical protein ACETWK_01100 [Candidatus Aminicenantaceae bacterium]
MRNNKLYPKLTSEALPYSSTKKNKTRTAQALAFFILLSIIHTWPLITNPAHLSRNDNADTVLCEWIVSWIAYQLPRDPLHLYEANIFYPEKHTLAFSEPLIAPALIGAPLRWLGVPPVSTFNLLLLIGFTLTGLAMYTLIRTFTGDHIAGLIAGSLAAFNPHTLTRIPQLQAQFSLWLPLALLALDRLLSDKRTKDALWLALFVTLATTTSLYFGVMTVVALGVALIIRFEDWWGRRANPFFPRIGLAVLLASPVVLLILAPYWHLYRHLGFARPLDLAAEFAAHPSYYLSTAGRLHYAMWSNRFYEYGGECLFPGLIAFGLLIVALASGIRAVKDRRIRMFIAIGITGILLSFGPKTPIYVLLYKVFPPFKGFRSVSRFGFLFLFAVAALAGYGLAKLRTRFTRHKWITPIAIVLVILVNLEATRAPMRLSHFKGIPSVYKVLAAHKGSAVVAEMPFYSPRNSYKNASYMLASTTHWKSLLNGWGGYIPKSYRRRADVFRHFPEEAAVEELQRAGVTHVVVHFNRYEKEEAMKIFHALYNNPKFKELASDPNGIKLYRFK